MNVDLNMCQYECVSLNKYTIVEKTMLTTSLIQIAQLGGGSVVPDENDSSCDLTLDVSEIDIHTPTSTRWNLRTSISPWDLVDSNAECTQNPLSPPLVSPHNFL